MGLAWGFCLETSVGPLACLFLKLCYLGEKGILGAFFCRHFFLWLTLFPHLLVCGRGLFWYLLLTLLFAVFSPPYILFPSSSSSSSYISLPILLVRHQQILLSAVLLFSFSAFIMCLFCCCFCFLFFALQGRKNVL